MGTDEGFGFGFVAYDDTVLDEPVCLGGGNAVTTTTAAATTTTAAVTTTTASNSNNNAFNGIIGTNPVITGFSSGAYMANQMFVAHSSTFNGLGLISGGAYSSNNVLSFSLGNISPFATQAAFDANVASKVSQMVTKAKNFASQNQADAVIN